ncbi:MULTISPECIES: 2Fe-2S iron-sulfur cluster-binding protein [unclassified Pseudomonas]|uniref:2Fe-2S iron-sulfur cluster-binding protein n=1 Tax=unclassified Pseudomonas TaxID=196821 RepID=UPI0021C8B3FE|nr:MULTISPECIES: 2Fe-2S iron-sulfur cluster-binding protein [unclassified Pseudomonas]MCU1735065.1 FAD-dependent oxidoreductase [Pseudomonas sp. 20P_3.2_Bac4]MCU1743540.1 FAD-dependent oxidoreductase [Pseudomonas sp. 20P_3.2_Bac5]
MSRRVNLRLGHAATASVEFYWNGRALQGRQGESVAVALLANGIRTLAWSRKSHRPLGYSGNYVAGVLARVNGVPNMRLDLLPVTAGARVEMQNCWPTPTFDLLRLSRLIPAGWIQGGFEHTNLVPSGTALFQRWEALLAFLAGSAKPAERTGEVAVPAAQHLSADVLVIGGGPAGCAAANQAAAGGRDVLLVTRGQSLARFACAAGVARPVLDPRVRLVTGVEVFGAYREGELLLAAPEDPAQGALALEADEVILASGRRACPPVVPGMWLPGVMEVRTALIMAHQQAVAPGARVVVVGNGDQQAVASRLGELGVNVVAALPVAGLRQVVGHHQVTAALFDEAIPCDALVHAGPWLTEASLTFQSRAEGLLQLREQRQSRLRTVGSASETDQPLPVAARSRHAALLCPCFDVSCHEVEALIAQGITDLEVIKRLTSCGMGPCQGQPCWDLLRALVSARSGIALTALARPTLRPPRRALTVAQAAGLAAVVEPLQ